MTPALEVTAPGKLVLLGEYAVLEGAPAVVMAIGRRARVRLQPSPDGAWRVAAPGVVDRPARARLDEDGILRWEEGEAASRLALVTTVVGTMAANALADPRRLGPVSLELDTTAFFEESLPGRPKLGLGSSAALTVALGTALAAGSAGSPPKPPRGGWLAALVAVHRAVQGGAGSGVDVAASLLGGTLRYALDPGGRPKASALPLPRELGLRFVWTGRPAGTARFLERLRAALAAGKTARERLDVLGDLARRGVRALESGAADRFLEVADAYCEGMAALGDVMGAPVLSPEHAALARLAAASGVAYKPSGAGGGDLGIAFSTDPDALHRFTRDAAASGFAPLDLPPAPEGTVLQPSVP